MCITVGQFKLGVCRLPRPLALIAFELFCVSAQPFRFSLGPQKSVFFDIPLGGVGSSSWARLPNPDPFHGIRCPGDLHWRLQFGFWGHGNGRDPLVARGKAGWHFDCPAEYAGIYSAHAAQVQLHQPGPMGTEEKTLLILGRELFTMIWKGWKGHSVFNLEISQS